MLTKLKHFHNLFSQHPPAPIILQMLLTISAFEELFEQREGEKKKEEGI